MDAWTRLAKLVDERFHDHLDALPGGGPCHRVEFSGRITTSWALIYYRRRLVRLSPYLFLLPAAKLKHATHWQELDATLRHEAAHAWLYARTGETGHTEAFHDALRDLGVRANGGCDLGPENAAYRYVYACPGCRAEWPRRVPLRGNWSCGACAPGRFAPEFRMTLHAELEPPARRLRTCAERVEDAVREALAAPRVRRVDATPVAVAVPPISR